jgi:hypothetical protein
MANANPDYVFSTLVRINVCYSPATRFVEIRRASLRAAGALGPQILKPARDQTETPQPATLWQ